MEVENGIHNGNGINDEITFLLRLRPSPTPPARRRRQSTGFKATIPNTVPANRWDITIERRETLTPPPIPPRHIPSLRPSAPPQEAIDHCPWQPRLPYNSMVYRQQYYKPPYLNADFRSIHANLEHAKQIYTPSHFAYIDQNYNTSQTSSHFINTAPDLHEETFTTAEQTPCSRNSSCVYVIPNDVSADNFVPNDLNVRHSDASLASSYGVMQQSVVYTEIPDTDGTSLSKSLPSKPPKPLSPCSLTKTNYTGIDKGEAVINAQSDSTFNDQGGDHEEKLRKLQSEKDNLQLQVQVLTEQIDAQGDKIADLEKVLTERKQQLTNSEDMLQREMLSRSSLETQKLELMSAISEMKLHQAALERENLELRSTRFNNNSISGAKPPARARASPQPHHSTPVHHNSNPGLNVRMSPSPSPVPTSALVSQSPRKTESNSLIQDLAQSPKTPPANYRRQIDIHYGSLPRQQFISNGEIVPVTDTNANTANSSRKGVAFGRGFYSLLGVRGRGHSVPNLAETEKIIIDENSDGTPSSPSLQFNKNKGIKKIFGRMRRSGSGNLEDIPGLSEFQRGGVRATAAARLGWSEPLITSKPDKPFAEWDTENICDWLQDLGLEQYISEAKRWIKNGQQVQEAPIQDIEKELGIKNVLHRKKLQLAIADSLENGCSDPYLTKAGKLDTAWVLRWLDDSGLPQHKEAFLINRVDGRVLHRLTVDDLSVLHVTSLLHVASVKRGIQVLRENDFEPGCLQRRSLPDDPEQPTPKQICLWTTHRVMEWLRAVDLAEYAPNLRGAGVHGGLMVLEDKFTSELLASLLNIPPGKTLLRRHLNTHFKELLGKDIIQEKRESEGTLGYIPLTPSAKLKVTKKSQFSLKRKKSKGEVDYGDLVCPLNPNCEDKKSRRSKGRGCLSSE
ncbi:hypothetical protein RI129_007543 [Pyrocoelia pectoralis]|uniref:SAM domain-containing protein n=1 Tax=Pyrocoelia pectoralis TaxID=417401 RepID=A0AAN7VE97_9COLE